MNEPKNIAFLVFLFSIIVSRIIQIKAQNKLEPEKKSQLLDIGNKNQIAILVSIGVIFLAFFLVVQNQIINNSIAFIIYMVLILGISLINILQVYAKMKKLDFPINFIQSYIISTIIRLGGLVTFLILILQ